ncbi:MAG TPA: lysozyme [Qipengyuania sp.]|nr:lysozyme [Qipengyuania sp.]
MQRRPIFDVVRRLLGRGLRQREVDEIDAAIGAALEADGDPSILRAIGPDGIALIKRFEGCARLRPDGRFAAYPDPGTGGAPWTIGWGATGPGIGPGTIWTQAQCDARLEADLVRYAADVTAALAGAPTTQHQFDALVSFHYNTGAIARATLTRRHKEGDFAAAAAEFARWNRAGGRVLQGLVRRRAAEARLYLN